MLSLKSYEYKAAQWWISVIACCLFQFACISEYKLKRTLLRFRCVGETRLVFHSTPCKYVLHLPFKALQITKKQPKYRTTIEVYLVCVSTFLKSSCFKNHLVTCLSKKASYSCQDTLCFVILEVTNDFFQGYLVQTQIEVTKIKLLKGPYYWYRALTNQ